MIPSKDRRNRYAKVPKRFTARFPRNRFGSKVPYRNRFAKVPKGQVPKQGSQARFPRNRFPKSKRTGC